MILKTSTDSVILNTLVKSIIPALTFDQHKGQCGRVGVIGGSPDYTGAPYFAAISSLKVGCDVAHVFCPREAATVIKSYSPELIVHPVLNPGVSVSSLKEKVDKIHSFVLGPGLGRDQETAVTFGGIIGYAGGRGVPLVIDADGLHFVSQSPSVLRSGPHVVLTPNEMEFSRMYKAVFQADCAPAKDTNKAIEETMNLCKRMGNVTVVRKGASDVITDGASVVICDALNSPRRCGGQGDLLSGSMGTFLHWSAMAGSSDSVAKEHQVHHSMIAGYAACLLTRQCNQLAYEKFGRSTTTTDMIDLVHVALRKFVQQ